MRILICNERFLFRFGVDRCLLMLGSLWKAQGHEIIMMGNRLDERAVDKCSDRFISVPEALEYLHGNDFTLFYLQEHWDEWFNDADTPDLALVAGWPFYRSIGFLREKCGCAIFHEYGAVPTDGMDEGQKTVQNELRRLRRESLPQASAIIAISRFLMESQSNKDTGGRVPAEVAHCGVDHIVQKLWQSGELGIRENDVLKEIRQLKEQGIRIIFQPGRWETGNYKNSDGSVTVSRFLTKRGIDHRILVLSARERMGSLPSDVSDKFFCLGFVDDETMRAAMELSDVGISPTLWEGFDLPLGEMQWLDRPMFVLNVGAHPEVVCDPYFLCKDMDELARKTADVLQGSMPFTEEEFKNKCAAFREVFTWQNCADKMMDAFRRALRNSTTLYVDVTNACHDTANSGVMRVTRKLSRYLQGLLDTVFVLWDCSIKQYVLPYEAEVRTLCAYGGPDANQILERSQDGKPRETLETILTHSEGKRRILLMIETADAGMMKKAIPSLQARKIAVAAVFHDAIPVLRPDLVSKAVCENHSAYIRQLATANLVLPTADHNGTDLKQCWKAEGVTPRAVVRTAALAAEIDGVPRYTEKLNAIDLDHIRILFVSTLEPRKNHIRFLKALEQVFRKDPELAQKTEVHLVGNRYAGNEEIPAFVERFCADHSQVRWLGVVDDETLRREYATCTFTVYPSEIEGFGMPIIESLWAGKPCLCSNSGSIGELAALGGCMTADVLDVDSLSDTLHHMMTEPETLLRLQREAVTRPITTWRDYADSVATALTELSVHPETVRNSGLPSEVQSSLQAVFAGWNGRRVVTVSNYYPPNIIGGAEIIAHKQLRTLIADNHARGVAFTLDISGKHEEGTVTVDTFEGVPVVRLSVPGTVFDANGIHFFSAEQNRVFRELCELVHPTVVHFHNMFGLSMGIVDIAHAAGAKVVFTLHDNWGFCFKNTMLDNRGNLCGNILACDVCKENLTAGGIRVPMGVRRCYLRRCFERTDAFVSPSAYLADTYIRAGFDAHKMNVIWNGITLTQFAGCTRVPSDLIRVTFAGYFGAHKGIDVLIRAVALTKRSDIQINLVGSGAEEENYKALAASLGIAGQLRFWGRLSNAEMIAAYRETDIYCLPSVWPENQPVSITEAMACGIPVLASDLGGNRELVKDGETGLLFPAGNAEALAEKLVILCKDEKLREQMGQAGCERIGKASLHRQVGQLAELYDHLPPLSGVRSKPLILFKGTVLPTLVHRFTRYDVMLWDWVLDDHDLQQTKAVAVLNGERLSSAELKKIRDHSIRLVVPARDEAVYRREGVDLAIYADEAELLRMIATL
ncbi:MAG: glycosyltransferase [Clostridia bacterium]|nr:glycosyltransferase [Clostridia bacterium]